jgi:hypothetical protein
VLSQFIEQVLFGVKRQLYALQEHSKKSLIKDSGVCFSYIVSYDFVIVQVHKELVTQVNIVLNLQEIFVDD